MAEKTFCIENHPDPHILGAQARDSGVGFAVFSRNAEKIELCLFDSSGKNEIARLPLPGRDGGVWHGFVPGLKPGQIYGYRAHGAKGFNPQKLMIDPYATDITGDLIWDDALRNPASDSAASVPKARIGFDLPAPPDTRPKIPADKTIVYEMHVKGFTQTLHSVPENLRGTYAGLGHAATIDYLKKLGVTTVELLPVAAKVSEEHLDKNGLVNYWGYNTVAPFAVEKSYAATENPQQEFRDMVQSLHQAGIEVVLDVVFNHTAEHDDAGPTLSLRGLDQPEYYRIENGKNVDMTGCGNTLDASKPQVRKMIVDCLKHWATQYNVDGFRFDLATVLARDAAGRFDPDHPLFTDIAAEPALRGLKMIAEPWDIGPGGYQLGRFPPGWMEWNDKFRDDIRKYWRGDADAAGALATRLAGSSPEFDAPGKGPLYSVNMITAHDGFTLADLTTYHHKRNQANGQNNNDGADHNLSCAPVAHEDTQDPVAHVLRQQVARNMLTTLFLAQGTPMLLAGDEHGNSQDGNNNPYCQDNNTGWLNWDRVTAAGRRLNDFVEKLIAFRKETPLLSQSRHLHGKNKTADGCADLEWRNPDSTIRKPDEWNGQERDAFIMTLNGDAAPGEKTQGRIAAIFNRSSKPHLFKMPPLPDKDAQWKPEIDTTQPDAAPNVTRRPGQEIAVPGRSVLVFSYTP